MECRELALDVRDLNFSVEHRYNIIMNRIVETIKNGECPAIWTRNCFIIDSRTNRKDLITSHIMTIFWIDKSGKLIVDSWGRAYKMDLRSYLEQNVDFHVLTYNIQPIDWKD